MKMAAARLDTYVSPDLSCVGFAGVRLEFAQKAGWRPPRNIPSKPKRFQLAAVQFTDTSIREERLDRAASNSRTRVQMFSAPLRALAFTAIRNLVQEYRTFLAHGSAPLASKCGRRRVARDGTPSSGSSEAPRRPPRRHDGIMSTGDPATEHGIAPSA
jgi:hypothetical protein